MIASNTLELPYCRGIGILKGRGFGDLPQDNGRTDILFTRKCIVAAAKRVGVVLLEFAEPEGADVVIGKKKFETATKNVGRQALRKQLGGGKQKKSIGVKTLKRSSRSRRDIFTKIAI